MPARLLKQDKIDLLSQLPLFEDACTQKELGASRVPCCGGPPPGASFFLILTREGQLGGIMFIIVEGQVDLRRNKQRLAQLGPGAVVGELSLIDGQARSASLVATQRRSTPCELAARRLQRLTSGSHPGSCGTCCAPCPCASAKWTPWPARPGCLAVEADLVLFVELPPLFLGQPVRVLGP